MDHVADLPRPELAGVHHTAFATWKPKETVEFYRDVLGLKPIHAVTAKGWGRDAHPDFIHFFFDAGQGSAIAFFYYIGTEPMAEPAGPRGYLGMARHTSWTVETQAELEDWKARLEAKGVAVSQEVQHEVVRSLYFRDPNGYPLEISLTTRVPDDRDAADTELTLQAMIETFADGPAPETKTIEDMWRRKGELVAASQGKAVSA
ncbi:MAG: VOC family protein [Alphaproteobacteria bacterium]|nr:VOC family protein [Alphaproteobacteria bacterium]